MTNSEPPRRRKPTLTLDEIIACIVALGTIGTILYFGTRNTGQAWFKGQDIAGVASTAKDSEVVAPSNPSVNQPTAQAAPSSAPNPMQPTPGISSLVNPLAVSPSPFIVQPNSLAASPPTTATLTTPQGVSPKVATSVPVPPAIVSSSAFPSPAVSSATIPSLPTTIASSPSPAVTVATTPIVNFPDIPDGYWAKPFIEVVAGQKLMTALADGKFSPDQAMTRADFAQALQQVLALTTEVPTGSYPDVAADNPNLKAIQAVTKAGFMRGYPDGQFKPNQPVTRQDVLVTLMSGLNLQPPQDAAQVLQTFQDANQIPAWANGKIAAATANNLVVNYPDVKILQPQKTATRGEVAAFLYQALVKQGKAKPMDSPYVVKK